MTETTEFETNYEELELANDMVVGTIWLVSTDGNRFSEYLYYPPYLLPEDGRYLPAPYSVRVSVSDERLSVSPSVGPLMSIQEFEGRIVGVDRSGPAVELLDLETGDWVAQILLDPEHLPEWLRDEGDTCYVSIRLEYDHEAMLDYYSSEAKIEEKREQFQDNIEELEEYL